jgi:hypothetical protein
VLSKRPRISGRETYGDIPTPSQESRTPWPAILTNGFQIFPHKDHNGGGLDKPLAHLGMYITRQNNPLVIYNFSFPSKKIGSSEWL